VSGIRSKCKLQENSRFVTRYVTLIKVLIIASSVTYGETMCYTSI